MEKITNPQSTPQVPRSRDLLALTLQPVDELSSELVSTLTYSFIEKTHAPAF